jgi:hypothetical protein
MGFVEMEGKDDGLLQPPIIALSEYDFPTADECLLAILETPYHIITGVRTS